MIYKYLSYFTCPMNNERPAQMSEQTDRQSERSHLKMVSNTKKKMEGRNQDHKKIVQQSHGCDDGDVFV